MNSNEAQNSVGAPGRKALSAALVVGGLTLPLPATSTDAFIDVLGGARRAGMVVSAALLAVGAILLCAGVSTR